ncbi:MAG: hypothetical protein ACJ74J_13150 [Blastocatellia bacterium]
MTASNDDSPQGRGIFSDEERQVVMRSICEGGDESERREAFAELLIDLRQRLGEHGEGWQQVSDELHRLVEWLFNGSEAYTLALELYERRFSLPAGSPATVLREVLDEQLDPSSRAEQKEPAAMQTKAG